MSQNASGECSRGASLRDKVKERFTQEEIKNYRKHFEVFDLNRDGEISASELEQVARNMGYKMPKKNLKDIMRATDLDENGTISFEEFVLAMPGNVTHIHVDEHRAAEIRRKFIEYDRIHTGRVNSGEAHGILRNELSFTPQQSFKIVEKYDKGGNGYFSYEEFIYFYKHVRSKSARLCELLVEYDRHHHKKISTQDCKHIAEKLHLADGLVDGILAIHDTRKDPEQKYQEFVELLLHS